MSSFDDDPLDFVMGDGTLEARIEQHLLGMTVGTDQSLSLSPDQAYGQPEDERLQRLSRDAFPADLALAEGRLISFTLPDGNETLGLIEAIGDTEVLIDFNHPLAGKPILLRVKILAVEAG